MMALFSSFSIASQSLLSFKRGIDITNGNLANVYSEGYSRQNPVFANLSAGGVEIANIERAFDQALFSRFVTTNQQLSSDESYIDVLEQIESVFNDIQGSGFSESLDSFFNSMQDISVNPSDPVARKSVLTKANNLIGRIRTSYESLTDIRENSILYIKDNLTKINELTSKLANLNSSIRAFTADPISHANYLDERDRTLKELSTLIDTKTTFHDDGTVSVATAKGFSLVLGNQAIRLDFKSDPDKAVIVWNGTDITSELANGKVGGFIKGVEFANQTIDNLNKLTTTLASKFNAQHRLGYDINGAAGSDFFVNEQTGDETGLDASNIALGISDPQKIAAAENVSAYASDNGNIKKLIAIKDQTFVDLDNQTLAEFYNLKLTGSTAFELSGAKGRQENSTFLLESIKQKISEKSGVNMDEELINLTKLQRAYEASAKVISVTDEMIQTLLGMIK